MKSLLRNTVLAMAAPLLLATGQARAALELNMPRGVTEITREVYGLHMLIFWICVAIGVVVFGAMIWSLIYHRHSKGAKPAQFHESTTVEIAWTLVPFLILIGMAIPAAGTLIKIEDASDADMSIKVTGYQWMWEYEYLDHDVQFFSRLDEATNQARQLKSGIDPTSVDNYLRDVDKYVVVPVDQKVRLLLASNDVIHAWWVPELSGKKDAIPGFINEMWFKAEKTGIYRGQCAELCGRGHGYMPIVVKVVTESEFEAWVNEQGGSMTTDAAEQAASGTQVASAGTTATDAAVDAPADSAAADEGEGQSSEPVQMADAGDAGDAQADGTSEGAAGLSMDDLMAQGKKVYDGQCAACHQVDGSGMAAAGFPAMKGSPVATGDLAEHIDQILNGKGAMPPYKDTLSDEEIAAVITYERNAFGNETGDIIQPADIADAR